MNGKPRPFPALLRSVQYSDIAQMPSARRTGKMVDKAILCCLAQNASDVGAGARPGNAALMQAAGVGHSQLGIHLDRLIAAKLIERTYRGDGHGNASAYRILYKHPAFPDRSPNGKEVFVRDAEQPPGLESLSQEQPSGLHSGTPLNHPVTSTNHPVTMPDTILIPSQSQPNHPSHPKADGWEGFVEKLPAMMRRALHTLGGSKHSEVKVLVAKHGAELTLAAVELWIEKREMSVDGIKRNKWTAFLDEYESYLDEARGRTPEGIAAKEADEQNRIRSAEEFASRIAREALAAALGEEQKLEETEKMLRELSK